MDISQDEIRKSLNEMDTLTSATRKAADLAGADVVVMSWGGIWFLGFLWSHFVETRAWPNNLHSVWFLLIAAGVLLTILMERRMEAPVKTPVGKRIGFFWWTMYGYVFLGVMILSFQLKQPLFSMAPQGSRAIAAINTIIPMFAYVVMGLWLEQSHFIYIGLGLTVLTCIVYFIFNPVFFIVMSIIGGGILFGYGFWMRLNWSRAIAKVEKHADA
jgi:hypothetical protein